MSASPGEDRIRIDAVDPQGIFQAVWITRRLADRFLPHLAAHAEKQVRPGLPPELVLSIDQEKLRSDRAEHPIAPVQVQPAIAPWLCRTIHLKDRAPGLVWTMTDDAANRAHMVLAGDNVRALLDVFLNSYRKLEWTEQAFPEWIREHAIAAPARLN